MFGITERHFFGAAVVLYGLSTIYSVFLWRKGFRRDNRINFFLLLAGFGLNLTAMMKRGFTLDRCPVNNLFEAMMFSTWTLVGVYLAVGVWPRLRFLGAFASPVLFCMGVFALMPALDTPRGPKPEYMNPLISAHAALILLAYGSFGLGSVASFMYLTQERDLKLRRARAILSMLPPIQRLEQATIRLLVAGLILLTLGLGIGAGGLKRATGFYFKADPKVIWSMFVWAAYAVLIFIRWRFSQGGRRFAWGAVAVFAFLMLTFWGTNLLSGIHNAE